VDVSERDFAERRDRRPAAVVYGELEQLAALAQELEVSGRTDVSDYDAGLTSDDF
jgi:hypothetical protein